MGVTNSSATEIPAVGAVVRRLAAASSPSRRIENRQSVRKANQR